MDSPRSYTSFVFNFVAGYKAAYEGATTLEAWQKLRELHPDVPGKMRAELAQYRAGAAASSSSEGIMDAFKTWQMLGELEGDLYKKLSAPDGSTPSSRKESIDEACDSLENSIQLRADLVKKMRNDAEQLRTEAERELSQNPSSLDDLKGAVGRMNTNLTNFMDQTSGVRKYFHETALVLGCIFRGVAPKTLEEEKILARNALLTLTDKNFSRWADPGTTNN